MEAGEDDPPHGGAPGRPREGVVDGVGEGGRLGLGDQVLERVLNIGGKLTDFFLSKWVILLALPARTRPPTPFPPPGTRARLPKWGGGGRAGAWCGGGGSPERRKI